MDFYFLDMYRSHDFFFFPNHQQKYLKTSNNEIILDAYNANPTSMKLAIENFAKIKANNKIVILGDMLDSHELRQLSQRITLKCHLRPLTLKETKEYIRHRIRIASHNDCNLRFLLRHLFLLSALCAMSVLY